MTGVSERVAALSPQRRKLLAMLRDKRDRSPPQDNAVEPAGVRRGEPLPPKESAVDAGRELDASALDLAVDDGLDGEQTKATYRRFYDAVTRQLDATDVGEASFFLNWGYAPNRHPQHAVVELPQHYLNKNSVKLVLELIGDCPVDGRRVLDVGCGRGGIVWTLQKFFEPASIVGIDLSPDAIAFCTRTHKLRGVSFCQGDAERLPFEPASFDVVTNVESAHGYPDVQRFYREVHRVLTVGGQFLYTDMMRTDELAEQIPYLKSLGFVVERNTDITSNVLLSCDQIAQSRARAFDEDPENELMNEFLCVPGTHRYNEFASGVEQYFILRLRKSKHHAD